jgi:hypothetical protein
MDSRAHPLSTCPPCSSALTFRPTPCATRDGGMGEMLVDLVATTRPAGPLAHRTVLFPRLISPSAPAPSATRDGGRSL